MMIKRIVPAMVLLLLATVPAWAQNNTYALPDVWQQVLQYYPSLKARKAAVEAQVFKRESVRENALPDIMVQAQQSYGSFQNAPGSFFPLPGMFTTNGSDRQSPENFSGSNFFSTALLQWNFMQFGRQQKKLSAAGAAVDLSNTQLKQEEWNLLLETSRLYFTSLAAMAALDVVQYDSRRLTQLYELLQAQANAGLRPGADTLLLKASLLQSRAKEQDFGAQLKNRLAQLGALMGANISASNLDGSVFHKFQTTPVDANELFKNHPYLLMMEARVDYVRAEKEVVKKERYPTISLLAGIGVKGSGIETDGSVNKSFTAPWLNARSTYLAGIGLTWNFSSLYQNKTKRATADQMMAAAEAEKETAEIQLQAQYAAARAAWEEQKLKLASTQSSLNASRGAYELYEVRYQSGLLSLIELLQLQKNLQEAESSYISALSSYWNELLNQAAALGDPSLFLTLINPKP